MASELDVPGEPGVLASHGFSMAHARDHVEDGVAGPTQDAIGRGATVATDHDTEGSPPDAIKLEVQ